MSRKYKVDELLAELTTDEVEQYRSLLRQPASTIDDLLAWFGERGLRVSRGAVWKHRRHFDEQAASLRRSAEMARAFVDVARTESVESISDAALFRLSQVLMEQAMRLDAEGDLDPKDLERLTRSIRHLIGGKREVEDLRRRQREAVAEAQRLAEAGAGAGDVVETIKQALGISRPAGEVQA